MRLDLACHFEPGSVTCWLMAPYDCPRGDSETNRLAGFYSVAACRAVSPPVPPAWFLLTTAGTAGAAVHSG